MNLNDLKTMIEAEALRRQAAQDGFQLEAVKGWLTRGVPQAPGRGGDIPPAPTPLTLRYFTDLNGRQFVTACYRALLGREPDPGGLNHYVGMLLSGEEKVLIVHSIAMSVEARARGLSVQGLTPLAAIAWSKKIPIVGRFIGWALAIISTQQARQQQRAFEQQMFAELESLATWAAQSNELVASRIEALRAVLSTRD